MGFSDHTIGTSIPLAAISKGASVLEKHFTLDKNMPGWDHKVSATPEETKIIVAESKRIYRALGSHSRTVSEVEMKKRKVFRRSVVVVRDVKQGEVLLEKDLDLRRPGIGIPPKLMNLVVGRTLKSDLKAEDLVSFNDLV